MTRSPLFASMTAQYSTRLMALLGAVALVGTVLQGQQDPRQSVAGFKVAPGLELKLWAAEPMVLNPTDLTVDERGRVWVLEGVNYRRTQRNLPDPRPEGDRIVILEDTDQDGQADKVKVFDQSPQIRVPLGIAVLGDKVYVSQAPDLIVYTKDKDDKIVKKEVLLTGFGGIDHDHGLHAVVFGPDGKYYFNQGNTGFELTDKSGSHLQTQGTGANTRQGPGYFEGTALRMDADGTNVEVISQNFRNPYEIALDSFGNVFQTDNDDDGNAWTRLVYNLEGGNYGFRGPLNRTWLEDRGTHWHTELPGVVPVVARLGAGSPCGLVVYEGTLLPAAYRGQLLHAEAGKRIVAMYPLANDGAGFSARIEDVVNGGQDTWARPTDVAVAPDGAVFVTDWYDPGVGGHQMGDPNGGRGRVYRLAPAGNKPQAPPRVDLTSNAGLTAALGSPNQSTQYLAHTAIAAQGQAALPLLQGLWRQNDPLLKARALWMLGPLGSAGSAAVQEALNDQDPKFRVLGLRVAQLSGANMLSVVKPLLHDSSPQVRREVAAHAARPRSGSDASAVRLQRAEAAAGRMARRDGAAGVAIRRQGSVVSGGHRHRRARTRGCSLRPLEERCLGEIERNIQPARLELRPKTALGDLIAVLNNPSASSEQRTNALDTLGAMEWPEAARALEAFITSPSSAPPLVEHAFGLYSHQLFSWWMDARTSPALPQIVRKMFAAPGAQVAAVAMVDVLGDAQYVPDLMALAKSLVGGAGSTGRRDRIDRVPKGRAVPGRLPGACRERSRSGTSRGRAKPSPASGSPTSRAGTRPSSLATRRTRFAPRRCAGWPARCPVSRRSSISQSSIACRRSCSLSRET